VNEGVACINPTKISGLCDWLHTLKTVKEVQQVLGILGYQWPFVCDFTKLACPLTSLTKKGWPFSWTEECWQSLDTLITQVCKDPELNVADWDQPFELEVNTSQYALGAVLFQQDEWDKWHAVGYASWTLNEAECNYDIWDREFMALVFGLEQWKLLLAHTDIPVKVFLDHANLAYYHHPQKISCCVTWGINTLAQYNFKIIHKPGDQNCTDALSRQPDYPTGGDNN
jgi:RNase H-like domain found in reverse transcriptase